MLIECGNCGAPLDVATGRSVTKCAYCGISQQVRSARTVLPETPPNWQPPPRWTPPAHFPAQSVPLTYQAVKSWLKAELIGTAILMGVVLLVAGGVGAGKLLLGGDRPSAASSPVGRGGPVVASPGAGPVPAVCRDAAACCRAVAATNPACATLDTVPHEQACRQALDAFRQSAQAMGKSCP